MRHLLFAFMLAMLGIASPALAQDPPADGTSAEVRIKLPDGASPDVAVEPDIRRVIVELPRGAALPLDFQSASGGLIHDSKLQPLGDDRIRLQLDLAAGYLARFAVEGSELVLTFASKRRVSSSTADAGTRYLLGPQDKILVTVQNQPDLTTTLTVSREGTVTAPLIGEIEAAGLSPTELETRISEALGRSYLVDPSVDVSVDEYNSQWVLVSGEVPLTGQVPLRGGTRLKEVLSEAGGFRETAGRQIVISRRKAGTDEFETVTIERKDFDAGIKNPVLQAGDIIEVTQALYCYIQGEVRSPGRVPCEREITLLRAITMVGGLTEWADRKSVRILHSRDDPSLEDVVNLKRIQDGKAPDPLLRGGEVVVVKRRFF